MKPLKRKKSFIIILLILFLNLLMAGCTNKNDDDNSLLFILLGISLNSSVNSNFSTVMRDTALTSTSSSISNSNSKISTGVQKLTLADNSKVQGLYYSEFEIIAYDYRPGESIQEIAGQWGLTGSNFSYWGIAPSGYTETRDNILKTGGVLNLKDLIPPGFQNYTISNAFRNAVGSFEIDLVEVYMSSVGVLYNGTFYGRTFSTEDFSKHPLYKYPEYSSYPINSVVPSFTGITPGSSNVSIIFARDDWFPTPVSIKLTPVSVSSYTIDTTSRALSVQEQTVISDFIGSASTRRGLPEIIIVPYAGPIKVKFTGSTNEAGLEYTTADLELQIKYDLLNLLDTNGANTDLDIPKLTFSADGNNVPMGISLNFTKK